MVRYYRLDPEPMATPERPPRRRPQKELPRPWDMDSIAQALLAPGQEAKELALGHGQRFALGQEETKIVEFFPQSGVVRVTTDVAQIALHGVLEPQVSPEGILIERGDAKLEINVDGNISFTTGPGKRQAELSVPESEETPVEVEPSQESKPSKAQEAKERLALLGRVGATPSFRTTPKGTLVARFPLAVHEAENKTTWHTILAFGERAEKLKESLEKGNQVEVIGYRHTREARTKDGRTKTVEEIYGVVFKNR